MIVTKIFKSGEKIMENKKINIKISLVLNIIIAIMTLFAASVMFTGFKFMNGYEPI